MAARRFTNGFRNRLTELLNKRLDASLVPGFVRLYNKALVEIDAALADRPWLAGGEFTIAECALLPYVWRFERLGLDAMWDDKPHLADWLARAKEWPSWRAAMAANPPIRLSA